VKTTTVVEMTGDPRHLAGVRETLRQVRELLGLNVQAAANECETISDVARRMAERAAAYEAAEAEGRGEGEGGAHGQA
jgi:hypothetical protein